MTVLVHRYVRSAEVLEMTTLRRLMLSGAAAVALVPAATSGYAATCPGPNVLYTSDVVLGADYVATSGPCFLVSSGADVNLNGHTIECSNGSSAYFGAAVEARMAGTIVENGVIKGKWEYGTLDAEITRDTSFETPFFAGVGGDNFVKKITNNWFQGCGYYCIKVHINVTTGGLIQSNRIDTEPKSQPTATEAIEIEGTASGNGPLVKQNYIIRSPDYVLGEVGIVTEGSSHVRLFDNIIIERRRYDTTPPIVDVPIEVGNAATVTLSGNDCGDPDLCPMEVPYVLP